MKCEKCNAEIAEGKGYYFTLKGAICTRCYDDPRYELELRNIEPQSYFNSGPRPNLSISTPLPPFAWNEPLSL